MTGSVFQKYAFGLGLFLVVALPAPALAEPAAAGYAPCIKTVTTSDSELAHQKYIAGRQDYEEGNYDSAVRRFRDAYNLDCTKHELLIIISAAYERKGDKKAAVAALESYVERAPSAPDVATYQAKIANLKKQIVETPPPPPPPPGPPTPSPRAPSEGTREHTVLPWVVAAAGGVALGVGIVLIATSPELPVGCDEKTKTCQPRLGEPSSELEQRKRDAGKAFEQPKWGAVVTVGGGVLVATGLLWHFLEPTGPRGSADTKIRPSVAPGYAGVSLGGSF